jgi:hypothetical protein
VRKNKPLLLQTKMIRKKASSLLFYEPGLQTRARKMRKIQFLGTIIVLLVEEYDLGAGAWLLTLPGIVLLIK